MESTVGYLNVHVGIFFFQAEDGIRDIGVTGVQTCALPIWFTGCCFHFAKGTFLRFAIYYQFGLDTK